MADSYPFQPENAPPAAVVRRHGEDYEELALRKAGYSDAQTGYSSSPNSRSNLSPLERSARIAMAREREARMVAQNDQEQANFQRSQELKEKQYSHGLLKEASALQVQHDRQNDFGGFLSKVVASQKQNGSVSSAHFENVLKAAIEHPVAASLPEGQKIVQHAVTEGAKLGVSPESALAKWEIGQARSAMSGLDPQDKLAYLESIPGKHPAAFKPGSQEFAMLKGLHDEITKLAKPEGLTPAQQELSTHREIRRLQSRDAQLAKDVAAVEKEPPAWFSSTGYEEKTGQFRFADEGKDGTKPFKPSETQLAQYRSYKSAVAERAGIAEKVGQHEAKLSAGFDPSAAPAAQSDAPVIVQPGRTEEPQADVTPEAHAKLKTGDKFWWKGQQLTKE